MKNSILVLFLLVLNQSNAALIGTYTVNPSAAASASNYQNIISAVFDLTQATGARPDGGPRNGPNISGPVVFDISNGVYKGKLAITTFTGASATNTVTFQSVSKNPMACIIEDSATTSAQNGVVHISGADYVRFKNVYIRSLNNAPIANPANYATTIIIDSFGTNTSSHTQFYGCRISSKWFIYDFINNACVYINGYQDSTTFVRDTFANAGTGIYVDGHRHGNNYTPGLTIDSCLFSNFVGSDVFQPLRIKYVRDLNIRYNVVTKNGCCADQLGQFYAIRVPFEMSYNKFYMGSNSSGRGFVFDSLNTINEAGQYAKIYNNFFQSNYNSNGSILGFNRSARVQIVFNNFNNLNTVNTFRTIEVTSNDTNYHREIEIQNNMIFTNGAPVLYLGGATLLTAKFAISKLDYNNINRGLNNNQILYTVLGTSYTNEATLPNTIYNGSDNNTTFNPISYISASDLHLTQNSCFKGLALTGYNKDIDGTTRSNPSGIGAHEKALSTLQNDLAVQTILLPTIAGFTPGVQPVKALIKNFGSNTVTSFKLRYSVNGGAVTTYTFSGSLAQCDTTTITFSGANQYNFTAGTSFLKVYVDSVNTTLDSNKLNDTAYLTVCSALAGNYTINPSIALNATNFQSFAQLTSALNSCGVSAPVNVTVSPGLYLENVSFGNIPGNDTTKAVTIDGGNFLTTTLRKKTFNLGINYVLRLDNTNAIYFKNMTIQNDSFNVGGIVQAIGGDKLTFKKCVLEYSGAAATGTSFNNKIFQISGSYSPSSTTNTFYRSIEIDSCVFNNGYSAVDASFTNTTCQVFFRNNILNNQSSYGFYCTSGGTFKILGNVFSMRNNSSNSSLLLFNSNPTSTTYYHQINNNYFLKNGQNAIYTSSTRGGVNNTRRGEIFNNMIGGAFMTGGTNYGMQINYGDYWDIHNNSISMDSVKATTSVRGIYISAGTTTQTVRLKNNSISITDPTSVNPICVEINNQVNIDQAGGLDFNNYYNSKNGAVLLIGSVNYDSLNYPFSYPSGAGGNSLYGNPNYMSRYNLHTNSGQMDNKGTNLGVTYDIDNEVRSGTTPDIGADEFSSTVTKDLKAHSLVQPTIQTCFGGSSYGIQAKYQNSGSDSFIVTTDTIYAYVRIKDPNNSFTTLGPVKFSNLILKKDSFLTANFAPNYSMNVYGTYTFKVYFTWSSDTYGLNDSANFTRNVTNPSPVLTPATKLVFCSNDSSRLSAGKSLYVNTWQWYKDGAIISGAIDSFYFAKTAGKYYCKVTSIAGCALLTDSVVLNVNAAPTANITSDKTAFCPGDSVKFSCVFGLNKSYQWMFNNTVITGATDSIYYGKVAGDYSIKVTDNITTCFDYSNKITISTFSATSASISPSSATFCNGDSATLTTTFNSNYTYQWMLNASNISGAKSNTYKAKVGGNYSVKVTDSLAGCSSTSSSVLVTVNPNPTANIVSTSQTAFCSNDSSILKCATAAGQTYQWLKNGANISGSTDTSYAAKTTGNYQIKVTITATGCSSISTKDSLTVTNSPNASWIYGGPANFCAPDSQLIMADTIGGTGNVYQWLKNGSNITGATNFNYYIKSTGNYQVKVTKGICSNTSIVKAIVVGTNPTANINFVSQLSFCSNDSATMKCQTGAGLSYQWIKNASNISGATDSVYVANTTGNYQVKVTDIASGCNSTSSVKAITVTNIPSSNTSYTGPLTFCAPDSQLIKVDTVGGAGNTFQWIKNGSNISGATNYNYYIKTSGSYQVKVTKNTCESTSFVTNVTVGNAPTASIYSISQINFCSNDSSILKCVTGPGQTYQWIKNSSNIGGATDTQLVAKTSGNYQVKVTVVATGCNLTSAISTLNVTTQPTASTIYTGPSVYCASDSQLIIADTTNGTGVTYQWIKNGTDIPSATAFNYYMKTSGIYKVRATRGACNATSTGVNINVGNAPTASVVSVSKSVFCSNDSSILKCLTGAGLTYQWNNNGVIIFGATDSILIVKNTGNYAVKVTQISSGCNATSAFTYVSSTAGNPAVINYTGPTATCNGDSILLNADTTNGSGNTYQWVKNGSNISSATNFNYYVTTTGAYQVKVTKNTCLSTSTSKGITIEPIIDTTMNITGTLSGCSGASAKLTVPFSGGRTYIWYKDGVANGNTTNVQTVTLSGDYYVKISSSSGCFRISRTVTALYTPPMTNPIILPAAIPSKCFGDSVELTLTNLDPSVTTIRWFKNAVLIPSANNSNNYWVKTSGDYNVQVFAANGCGANAVSSRFVNFYFKTNTIINADKAQACEGDSITITLADKSGVTSCVWYKDNNIIPGSTGTSYTTYVGGEYRVEITDKNGCVSSSIKAPFTFFPYPVPDITQDMNTMELVSNYNSGNQWFLNNVKINKAINQRYQPKSTGDYFVQVTGLGGCIAVSSVLTVDKIVKAVNAIEQISDSKFSVSPNPSSGIFYIAQPKLDLKDWNYKVSDAQGKVIFVGTITHENEINLEHYATGTYYLELSKGAEKQRFKLIKFE